MTSYNGNAIVNDSDGNMTTFNGWIYTWEDGNLVGATGSGKAAAYVYNTSGIRTMKVLNGKVTNYTLDGNNVDSETTGTTTINYIYNSNDSPVYMTLNDVAYYYERNLQGDITGIVDSQGNEVVKYGYYSWGELLSITGTLASTVGEANHIRYRGYYYDTESGLYYLQSRYYNPEIGRFISKDDSIYTEGETGVRANLFAYCGNNPVMYIDPNGNIAFVPILIGIGIGLLIGLLAGWGYAEYFNIPKDKYWKYILGGALIGAVLGGCIGYAVGARFCGQGKVCSKQQQHLLSKMDLK